MVISAAVDYCAYAEDEADMKYSIPGLGDRLRRARHVTKLSQEAVATKIGVSWMTVHRWERSQRAVPDHLLDKVCELYDKPIRWFLTLEDGDLSQESAVSADPIGSPAAERIRRKIAEAPASQRAMIEKVVDDMLYGRRRAC